MNTQHIVNEPILEYRAESPERRHLEHALEALRGGDAKVPLVIGGQRMLGARSRVLTCPHDHARALCAVEQADAQLAASAVQAAVRAQPA